MLEKIQQKLQKQGTHIWRQNRVIGGGTKPFGNLINPQQIPSKYEKKSVEKTWFGVQHSDCLEQGLLILKELESQKPDLIILEGMTAWNVWNLEQKLNYLQQFENLSLSECLGKVREKGAVYFYLLQNLEKVRCGEIRIICGESSLEQEILELDRKYDKNDILEMYLIREICQFFRKVKAETDFDLEKLCEFVNKFLEKSKILVFLEMEICTENLSENCTKICIKNGKKDKNNLLEYLQKLEKKYKIKLQNFDPKSSRKLEYLMIPNENSKIPVRQIKETLSKLRDYFLCQKVENENSQNTFILYGRNHILEVKKQNRKQKLGICS